MIRIGIVGGGFCGTMTAIQIIHKCKKPCAIFLFNDKESLCKGVAYDSYSQKHLLNVPAHKMSALPDVPEHFLNWVMQKETYKYEDINIIANSFLPRNLYGEYLCSLWEETIRIAKSKFVELTVFESEVIDIITEEKNVLITLHNGQIFSLDKCVIATGNNSPRNPNIGNNIFFKSPNYYKNPWICDSVKDVKINMPVLIIGNGLTMVDTFIGLLENGFKSEIYSISPNGFNILPHRHSGIKYYKLVEELHDNITLHDLVMLIIKHVRAVRKYGVSAEPVIDSLRPHTQRIWRSFSDQEKETFMSRFRHLWGVARHRIPLHTHDVIQQLRIDGRLKIISGKIVDITEDNESVRVDYFNKKLKCNEILRVSRVINCTGPETDILKMEKSLLKTCLSKGLLKQDPLRLGISADVTSFRVIDSSGKAHNNIFTLGSNLRGELWESTAVHELREQAHNLAQLLSD